MLCCAAGVYSWLKQDSKGGTHLVDELPACGVVVRQHLVPQLLVATVNNVPGGWGVEGGGLGGGAERHSHNDSTMTTHT